MYFRPVVVAAWLVPCVLAGTFACGGAPDDLRESATETALQNCPRGESRCVDPDDVVKDDGPGNTDGGAALGSGVGFTPKTPIRKHCNLLVTSPMKRVVLARRFGAAGCANVVAPLCGTWRGEQLFASAEGESPEAMCRFTWDGYFPIPKSAADALEVNTRSSVVWGKTLYEDAQTVGDGSSTHVSLAPRATSGGSFRSIHGCDSCVARVDDKLFLIIPSSEVGRPLYLSKMGGGQKWSVTMPAQAAWADVPDDLTAGILALDSSPNH